MACLVGLQSVMRRSDLIELYDVIEEKQLGFWKELDDGAVDLGA